MDSQSIGYLITEGVISVLSVTGNAMVVWAIYRNNALQTTTNCFIASLALADLLVGLIATPCAVLSFIGLPRNFLGCVFINGAIILFTSISVFNLVGVATERFIAIKSPFFYQKHMTIPRAIAITVVAWIMGIILGLLPIFGWNLGPTEDMVCAFTRVMDMRYMVYLVFFGIYCVPLFIIVFIYMYIYVIVRQQMGKIEALEIAIEGKKKKKKFMKEIRAAKSMALVLGLFMVSWLPIHLINAVNYFCEGRCYVNVPYLILLIAILLSHANSLFNPFLYAYGNSKFKKAFKKMFYFFKGGDSFTSDEHSDDVNAETTTNANRRNINSQERF